MYSSTESSTEAGSVTAPRTRRMQVDAVDGFGGRSEEVRAVPTSQEAVGKVRKYTERPCGTTTSTTAQI